LLFLSTEDMNFYLLNANFLSRYGSMPYTGDWGVLNKFYI